MKSPGLSCARHKSRTTLGQSLIEVVVALAVAVLVIVALVRLTITSIRNASSARNRALAVRYAQEGIEEAKKLKEEQPNEFFSNPLLCNKSGEMIDVFTRTRTCSLEEETMTIVVKVEWADSVGTHQSRLETHLTKWK